MMGVWTYTLVVLLLSFAVCQDLQQDSADGSQRRLKWISRQLTGVKHLLQNLEGSSLAQENCDAVLDDIAQTVENIRDKVDIIKNIGEVIERIDLGLPGRPTNTVLVKVPRSIQECFSELETGVPLKTAAQITCMQELMWSQTPAVPRAMENQDARRIRRYQARRGGQPRSSYRIRREYRTLDRAEREAYHAAVQTLVQDGTLATFARIHQGAGRAAHGGPAFLPWHRAFLTSYEEALRRVDPNVSLPYWDSSLDNCMENPIDSLVWTEGYFGNGMGEVIFGPFIGIMTLQGPLEREYGTRSRLMTKSGIATMMTNCHHRNISSPSGPRGHNLELFHNNVHVWVGADMSAVGTAAYDPVFYMHHAYIDYLWEKFREHQRNDCGVDPVIDYGDMEDVEDHRPNDRMVAMPYYRNAKGAQDFWTTNIYGYEDAPSCDNNCGNSPVLVCNVSLDCCVPLSRFDSLLTTTPLPATTQNMKTTTFDFYGMTTPHCNHDWPWCHQNMHLYRNLNRGLEVDAPPPPSPQEVTREDMPEELPPVSLTLHDDLVLKKKIVPRNRGPPFIAEESDGRTFETRVADMEEATKKQK